MELSTSQFQEIINAVESDQQASEALDFLAQTPKDRANVICNALTSVTSIEAVTASIKAYLSEQIQYKEPK